MTTNFYDKLQYLGFVVRDTCKKNHFTLVNYVLIRGKGEDKQSKHYFNQFKQLSNVNDTFEQNYKSIFSKYTKQLYPDAGQESVVTPDELLAFTKAYELQKAELKKEIDMLVLLGASKDIIEPIEKDLLEWAHFHSTFYEHIQVFKA